MRRCGVWAIEGTGGHGAGLSRHLLQSSEIVIELDRPKRAARRNGAKSDPGEQWPSHQTVSAQPLRDRQLNRALHTVVQIRIRIQYQPASRDYVARRSAEGPAERSNADLHATSPATSTTY